MSCLLCFRCSCQTRQWGRRISTSGRRGIAKNRLLVVLPCVFCRAFGRKRLPSSPPPIPPLYRGGVAVAVVVAICRCHCCWSGDRVLLLVTPCVWTSFIVARLSSSSVTPTLPRLASSSLDSAITDWSKWRGCFALCLLCLSAHRLCCSVIVRWFVRSFVCPSHQCSPSPLRLTSFLFSLSLAHFLFFIIRGRTVLLIGQTTKNDRGLC